MVNRWNEVVVPVLAIVVFGVANAKAQSSKDAAYCGETIELHGYLSRAQFQCDISAYPEVMMQAARVCSRELTDTLTKNALGEGMRRFDGDVQKAGKTKACNDAFRVMQSLVRPPGVSSQPTRKSQNGDLVEYDPKAAQLAQLLEHSEVEAGNCMNEAITVALQLGRRSREEILTWATRTCGGKLYYVYKMIGRSKDECSVFLRSLAENTLSAIVR